MSIGNMPEDELDALFRKAASEYDPEYDPEAWQAMEKKLDAPLTPPRFFKWWQLSGLVILLFLGGLGLWVSNTYSPASVKPAGNLSGPPVATGKNQSPASANPTALSPQPPSLVQVELVQAEKKSLKPEQALPVSAGTRLKSVPGTGQPVAGLSDSGKRIIGSSRVVGRNSLAPGAESKKPEPVSAIQTPAGNQGKNVGSAPTTPDDSAATLALPAAATGTNVAALESLTPDSSLAPVIGQKVAADSAGVKEVKEKKSLRGLNRFTFSLVAAPDLTAVGFTNLGGISTNAGFLVGYNVTGKWQLTTGIIRAHKIYKASPNDYGNKERFWQNRRLPDEIEAVCQVLDIPVNIGYQVWQKGSNNLTLNTGLSSYLMRQEKYTYEYYPYGGNQGYSKDWQIKNQNQHLFSIYNLSVGYGRQLSRGVLLGVEPFVKVPLAGVGAGKIKLASAGVFFALSYRLPE